MFDITSEAVADTAPIHVKNAAGDALYHEGSPVQIIVYGPGSDAHGIVESRQTARALKRMQENDGKITVATHEERIAETAEDLADLTAAFVNLSYPPAGDKHGRELFAALYADQKLGFITKQVAKKVADWGNFKRGSAAA